MNKIAIIPARGGSKRIPKKNIKFFFGKPIIAYSIEVALQSGLFNTVMVSTDDKEIAEVAKKYGAQVPFFRSPEKSDDFTGTAEVLVEVLNEYKKKGMMFEQGCCIYPTAPFVTTQLLNKSFELFNKGNCGSLFPVIAFDSPIQRALVFNNNDTIQMMHPENYIKRSQDLQSAYHDAGQFYWFNCTALKEQKRLWMPDSKAIIIDALQAHDIDNETDWKLAEIKYKLNSKN